MAVRFRARIVRPHGLTVRPIIAIDRRASHRCSERGRGGRFTVVLAVELIAYPGHIAPHGQKPRDHLFRIVVRVRLGLRGLHSLARPAPAADEDLQLNFIRECRVGKRRPACLPFVLTDGGQLLRTFASLIRARAFIVFGEYVLRSGDVVLPELGRFRTAWPCR